MKIIITGLVAVLVTVVFLVPFILMIPAGGMTGGGFPIGVFFELSVIVYGPFILIGAIVAFLMSANKARLNGRSIIQRPMLSAVLGAVVAVVIFVNVYLFFFDLIV